jgi:hypothetical protein
VTARTALELASYALKGGREDTEDGNVTGLPGSRYLLDLTRPAGWAGCSTASCRPANLDDAALLAESPIDTDRNAAVRARSRHISAGELFPAVAARGDFILYLFRTKLALLHPTASFPTAEPFLGKAILPLSFGRCPMFKHHNLHDGRIRIVHCREHCRRAGRRESVPQRNPLFRRADKGLA